MRTKKAIWYEVSAKHNVEQEDGSQKSVTDIYVVDAVSFSDTEETFLKEARKLFHGAVEVKNINPATYKEAIFSDNEDDNWYKAKITFKALDEETGKEKNTNVTYMVQGSDLEDALNNIISIVSEGDENYVAASVSETKVMGFIER
jgi:hypothetical protein